MMMSTWAEVGEQAWPRPRPPPTRAQVVLPGAEHALRHEVGVLALQLPQPEEHLRQQQILLGPREEGVGEAEKGKGKGCAVRVMNHES
jgi:hypothetical protein